MAMPVTHEVAGSSPVLPASLPNLLYARAAASWRISLPQLIPFEEP